MLCNVLILNRDDRFLTQQLFKVQLIIALHASTRCQQHRNDKNGDYFFHVFFVDVQRLTTVFQLHATPSFRQVLDAVGTRHTGTEDTRCGKPAAVYEPHSLSNHPRLVRGQLLLRLSLQMNTLNSNASTIDPVIKVSKY